MFRCTRAPMESQYPANLTSLGFRYENGKFVDKNGDYFEYYHTDNERANDMRKETMHECARQIVAKELGKFDIEELHMGGMYGTATMTGERPQEPHVTILATEVSKLRTKKDVFIVCGEAAAAEQDAAVWAYRLLMGEGGVEQGSAVGLAAKMAAHAKLLRQEDDSDDSDDDDGVMIGMKKLKLAESQLKKQKAQNEMMPGLMLLNLGQLLYSHHENKSMSHASWLARPRRTGLDDEYEIDPEYNSVTGHDNAWRHVSTVFNHILPQILRDDVRLYVICIGDGAPETIDVFDQIFLENYTSGLAQKLEAVVLVEPDYNALRLNSDPLRNFLAVCGRSWVKSPLPYGRLVHTPKPVVPSPSRSPAQPVRSSSPTTTTEPADPHIDEADLATKFPLILTVPAPDSDVDEAPSRRSSIDSEDEMYAEHARQPVSCPTFSAGACEGLTELVWPQVMDSVLDFLWTKKEMAEKFDAMREASGLLDL